MQFRGVLDLGPHVSAALEQTHGVIRRSVAGLTYYWAACHLGLLNNVGTPAW